MRRMTPVITPAERLAKLYRNPRPRRKGGLMNEPAPPPADSVPTGQRLFDRPFLLLAAGILVMFLFYTGWGLWEILGLPEGRLP